MKKYRLSLVLLCVAVGVQYFRYGNRQPALDGPVCSKGYYPALATDFRLIREYHKFRTERKVDVAFMRQYVQSLQLFPGFEIWIRAGSHHNGDLLTLVGLLREGSIVLPFTLLTSDGDIDTESILPKEDLNFLLSSHLLVRWYSQNCTIDHPKLRPIPIGLDRHTHPIKFRLSLGLILQLILGRTQPSVPTPSRHPPTRQIILDTGGATHEERAKVRFLLSNHPASHIKIIRRRITRQELWRDFYGTHIAGVSVRGNGYDCHRTWEMIQAGMVPIVRRHGLAFESNFASLVVFVENWEEVLDPSIIERVDAVRQSYPVQLGSCRSFLSCPHDIVLKIAPEDTTITPAMKEQFRVVESQGFRVAVFDHSIAHDFLTKHFDSLVMNAFQALPSHRLRSELFKFCFLYVYGGVFLDSHCVLVAKLQDIVSPLTLVNGQQPGTFDLSFVAMCAGNPVCEAFIRRTVQESRREGFAFDLREDGANRLFADVVSEILGNVETSLHTRGSDIVWRDTNIPVVRTLKFL